jgi:LuxR family maltose regulon positive regulatory protein
VDLAARVIARAAEEAIGGGAMASLSGWLDALPDEVVRGDAELATYKGLVLYMADRRAEAAAYADLDPGDAPPSSRGRLICLQAHAALCGEAPGVAARLAREALEGLEEGDALFRDLALNVLGQALEQEGHTAAAAGVYRDAFTLRRGSGDQLGTLVVLTNLAFALNELGRRREALAYCREVVEEPMPPSEHAFSIVEGAYLAWSLLSLEANELDLARAQAARALTLCRQAQILDGVWWALYILARVHLARGEIDELRQVCRDTRGLGAQVNREIYGPWFAALEAQASLLQGDQVAAERWAHAARLSPEDVPHRWNQYPYVVYARLLLAQGRLDDALALLANREAAAERSQCLRSLITVYLQQALGFQALRRERQALARVEGALRLAAPQGYRRAFLDEGPAILEWLPRLRPVAPAFVDALLQAAAREASVSEREGRPSPLIEPLTEREREVLRLIAAGRSNPEIAELLYLSLNTVKWHARNLYGKLNVGNRVQAVARARELGLL